MALVKLGYGVATEWGATPKDPPTCPDILPRWDDACVAVIGLANQHHLMTYLLPDGARAQSPAVNGYVILPEKTPPLPPNIQAAHGLGPARCTPDMLQVLTAIGMVRGDSWTEAAEFVFWRRPPREWGINFQNDERFLNAVKDAVSSLLGSIADEIKNLTVITDAQCDELISRHSLQIAEARKKYGPKARLGEVPTKEQARKSLGSLRRNELDWIFFHRWRFNDGWLSAAEADATIKVFHDPLAIAMRRAVLQRLHPERALVFE